MSVNKTAILLAASLAVSGCASAKTAALVADQKRQDGIELIQLFNNAKAATVITALGGIEARIFLQMPKAWQDSFSCIVAEQCGGVDGSDLVEAVMALEKMRSQPN
jgi:hypothetical protein